MPAKKNLNAFTRLAIQYERVTKDFAPKSPRRMYANRRKNIYTRRAQAFILAHADWYNRVLAWMLEKLEAKYGKNL